jgi:hypothetical protein
MRACPAFVALRVDAVLASCSGLCFPASHVRLAAKEGRFMVVCTRRGCHSAVGVALVRFRDCQGVHALRCGAT